MEGETGLCANAHTVCICSPFLHTDAGVAGISCCSKATYECSLSLYLPTSFYCPTFHAPNERVKAEAAPRTDTYAVFISVERVQGKFVEDLGAVVMNVLKVKRILCHFPGERKIKVVEERGRCVRGCCEIGCVVLIDRSSSQLDKLSSLPMCIFVCV